MFRLGLGILLGWLIFDEEGKKASNKAGKFIKDKSGEAIDYASKHIDTDKVADFVKKHHFHKPYPEEYGSKAK